MILLAYLAIGAGLYVAAFISAPIQRGKAIGYITKRPASADPFVIGLEFIGRLLVMLIIIAGAITFWPLVWLPLLVGLWRLRKGKEHDLQSSL